MALNHILPLSNVALIFLYFSFFTCSTTADEDSGLNCVYTVYIRTSKTFNGGTNSNVGVSFYDETGNGVYIKDLVAWGGLMGQDHDYYERGNLDIFSGRGPCLYRPVCYMELISDGSGPNHEWYCNYVEVTTTGSRYVRCAQQLFTVEQWLASGGGRSSNNNNNNNSNNNNSNSNSNNNINQLIVTRDACNKYYYGLKRRRRGSSVMPVETLLAASA